MVLSSSKDSIAEKPWCGTKVKCHGEPLTNRSCYRTVISILLGLYIISCACAIVLPTSAWLIIEHLGGNSTEILDIIASNSTVARFEQREYLFGYGKIAPLCTNVAVGTRTRYQKYGPDSSEIIYRKECSPIPENATSIELSSVPGVDELNGKNDTLTFVILGLLCNLVTFGILVPLLQCPPYGCIRCTFTRSKRSTVLWLTGLLMISLSIGFYFAAIDRYRSNVLVPIQELFEAITDNDRWTNYKNAHPKVSNSFRYTFSTLGYRIGDGYTVTIVAAVLSIIGNLFFISVGAIGRRWLFFVPQISEIPDSEKRMPR